MVKGTIGKMTFEMCLRTGPRQLLADAWWAPCRLIVGPGIWVDLICKGSSHIILQTAHWSSEQSFPETFWWCSDVWSHGESPGEDRDQDLGITRTSKDLSNVDPLGWNIIVLPFATLTWRMLLVWAATFRILSDAPRRSFRGFRLQSDSNQQSYFIFILFCLLPLPHLLGSRTRATEVNLNKVNLPWN